MLSSLKKVFQICDDKIFFYFGKILKNIFCYYFMETLGNNLEIKTSNILSEEYFCNMCDYRCSRRFNWDRHVLTSKHIKEVSRKSKGAQNEQNEQQTIIPTFTCENCNKIYQTNAGLWKHKKHCITEDNKQENVVNKKDELIDYLMKENKEIKELVLELAKKESYVTNSNNTTNNTNSHNKAFNLQFFLNETCKDAMNIMDFVESIQLQLSDLERVGEKGFVDGISNIIIKNLKNLDVTQRPVHCTDKKRETIYVKDQDKWEKDDENVKMHKLVRKVQDKNFRMVQKFKEKYPDYNRASSKHSDTYNHIIIESMGGKGDNDFEKEEKIIKKVSKEITVEK